MKLKNVESKSSKVINAETAEPGPVRPGLHLPSQGNVAGDLETHRDVLWDPSGGSCLVTPRVQHWGLTACSSSLRCHYFTLTSFSPTGVDPRGPILWALPSGCDAWEG